MRYTALIAAALLAGCATSPDRIESSYVSPQRYASLDCQELAAERVAVQQRHDELRKRLERQRKNDNTKMGAGLLIFWPTLFFISGDGPEASEYADIQGQLDALDISMANKSCAAL